MGAYNVNPPAPLSPAAARPGGFTDSAESQSRPVQHPMPTNPPAPTSHTTFVSRLPKPPPRKNLNTSPADPPASLDSAPAPLAQNMRPMSGQKPSSEKHTVGHLPATRGIQTQDQCSFHRVGNLPDESHSLAYNTDSRGFQAWKIPALPPMLEHQPGVVYPGDTSTWRPQGPHVMPGGLTQHAGRSTEVPGRGGESDVPMAHSLSHLPQQDTNPQSHPVQNPPPAFSGTADMRDRHRDATYRSALGQAATALCADHRWGMACPQRNEAGAGSGHLGMESRRDDAGPGAEGAQLDGNGYRVSTEGPRHIGQAAGGCGAQRGELQGNEYRGSGEGLRHIGKDAGGTGPEGGRLQGNEFCGSGEGSAPVGFADEARGLAALQEELMDLRQQVRAVHLHHAHYCISRCQVIRSIPQVYNDLDCFNHRVDTHLFANVYIVLHSCPHSYMFLNICIHTSPCVQHNTRTMYPMNRDI